MGAPELLALSLGLSVVVGALGWAGGRGVERLSGDPRLRDRVWAAALILPALPPLAVGLMLLAPAPVRDIAPPPAGPSTDLVTASVEFAAVAPSAGPILDPTLAAWAVLGVAIVLGLVRLAALALRARRLLRIIGQAQAPAPAVAAMVEDAARDLAIRPPLVRISATAPEALLASLGRARLILPAGLTTPLADPATARAAIAHELSHLKRGDHRALWLEESLLVLLAVNPLMPMLRARRAAAREEACDALALAGAAPEARRAYARSLIEALRSRAAPQGSGGLPALTFTGAGRTTAMQRLRAVLSPAPAAGRGPRLMAVGLAGLIAALTGAGSLAVAGEREAVIRMAPVAATAQGGEAPHTVELGAGSSALLNGEPLPEGLPLWAVAAERIDVRTPPAGSGQVNLVLAFTGSTPVSVNGHRMPEGFPASGINGDAVARVDVVGDHVLYTLKPEAEVRLARAGAAAARRQTAPSPDSDFEGRLSNASAADYQLFCAAAEGTMDRMACSMLLWDAAGAEQSAAAPAFCAPNRTDADLTIVAERGRAVALAGPAGRGSAQDAARRALIGAFPCDGEPRAVQAEAVTRASASLGAEWEQRYGVRSRAESAARRDAYTAATGADYQRMCASQDPGEYGFCAGVLFRVEMAEARSASPAFCAPDHDDRAATSRFVSGARAGVAQVRVSGGQSPEDVARAGLVRAYPCGATRGATEVVARVPVALDYGRESPMMQAGEVLTLQLRGQAGDARLATRMTFTADADGRAPGVVTLPLTRDYFPTSGPAQAFELSATIGLGETTRLTSRPTTLRLAARSEASAGRLAPTLSFE